MSCLEVGAAIADVTPPVGIDVAGFCLRLTTRDVHRSLRVGALVCSDGERTVCLVTADLVGLTVSYATALREEIAVRLGIETDAVLVTCSHTHNAPALTLDLKIGGQQETWTELNETYERYWRAQTIATCERAAQQRRPARIGMSRDGRAAIGVNRRVRLPDGRMIIGRNPDRQVDQSVGVVRIDGLEGTPIAVLLNYACHPISLGPEAEIISPDYPGAARDTVESIVGAPAFFIQGAGADVAPADGMGDDPTIADRLGVTLGLEATKVWSTIETRNIERREEIIESYNAVASLITTELPLPPPMVRYAAQAVELPLQPLPSLEQAREILGRERDRLAVLHEEGATQGLLNIQRIEVSWAELLLGAVENPESARAAAVLQVLRVNDVCLVGLPVEPFVEIGRTILTALGEHRTVVAGYANGTVGYCPMAQDYPDGGYEVERAHHVYRRPAALATTAASLLVTRSTELASAAGVR